MARLRALARRPPSSLDVTLRLAELELDTATRSGRRAGQPLALTPREYALLEYLLRNSNRVVRRADILEHVWDDRLDPMGNVVDVLVGRVRRRIDRPGLKSLLHTVRGHGYMLSERAPADAD
jgi:DNA-binding response OmpR family regulator